MICFHFAIFVVLETTPLRRHALQHALWFAFILLSLSYWKQRISLSPYGYSRCDLLSFYYLCRTGNNCRILFKLRNALWFAFILLSLSYWKQPRPARDETGESCDLLSFYYLCRTGNNTIPPYPCPGVVVICFHFTIFVVLETTLQLVFINSFLLWFAFILLSLSYWKQRLADGGLLPRRCDLLSFYYLCRTGNNADSIPFRLPGLWFAFILLSLSYWKQQSRRVKWMPPVVICFHFTIFVVLETTAGTAPFFASGLWFAFILLSLSYWKQPTAAPHPRAACCDLLSFYYLCRTGNNITTWLGARPLVVICFHFTIFVVLETTPCRWRPTTAPLWFAFILLSLSYWKQRGQHPLSLAWVVICFHFTIFVVLETTIKKSKVDATRCDLLSFYYLCRTGNNATAFPPRPVQLWFAFILLSLSYWKQRHPGQQHVHQRCDLLSFYYLCRTGNNGNERDKLHKGVVICFHFTIFVVLETTPRLTLYRLPSLWFAFILLSLSYWKQLFTSAFANKRSCDLLSFYYLCRTGNNRYLCVCTPERLWFAFILLSLSYWKQPPGSLPLADIVVICFHFTIFVVLETTQSVLFVVCQCIIEIAGI